MLLRLQEESALFSTDHNSVRVTSQWRQFPCQISTLNHFSNAVKEHENFKERKLEGKTGERKMFLLLTSRFKCMVGVESGFFFPAVK